MKWLVIMAFSLCALAVAFVLNDTTPVVIREVADIEPPTPVSTPPGPQKFYRQDESWKKLIPERFQGDWFLIVYAGRNDDHFEMGNFERIKIEEDQIFGDGLKEKTRNKRGLKYVMSHEDADSGQYWMGRSGNNFVTMFIRNENQMLIEMTQVYNGKAYFIWKGVYLTERVINDIGFAKRSSMALASLGVAQEFWADKDTGKPITKAATLTSVQKEVIQKYQDTPTPQNILDRLVFHGVDSANTTYIARGINPKNAKSYLAAIGKHLKPKRPNFFGNGRISLIANRNGEAVAFVNYMKMRPDAFYVAPNMDEIIAFSDNQWRAVAKFDYQYYKVHDGYLTPDQENELRERLEEEMKIPKNTWDEKWKAAMPTKVTKEVVALIKRSPHL